MNNSNHYCCCIIGSTKLAIDCAMILFQSGIEVRKVYTDDPLFRDWSLSYRISVGSIALFKNYKKNNELHLLSSFDFLFSIVNDVIISSEVVATIKRMCINYHNGPLPKYGGCNAVNWALINGERSHGVSWHLIEKKIDCGRILSQTTFDIDFHDTLFDINAKCKQAAEASFTPLCAQLCNVGINLQPSYQNELVSYYGINQKPSPFCLLPLKSSAEIIRNFHRGTFHLYGINELGLPKLLLPDGTLLVVSKLSSCTKAVVTKVGTVTVSNDYINISCGNHSLIQIEELTSMEGVCIDKPFCVTFSTLDGCNLLISEKVNELLSSYSENMGKNARRWANKLIVQDDELSLSWPYFSDGICNPAANEFEEVIICEIFDSLLALCEELKQPLDLVNLSFFLTFLISLSSSNSVYIDVLFQNIPQDYPSFFLAYVPVLLKVSPNKSFSHNLAEICSKLSKILYVDKAELPPSDLFLCYPIKRRNNVIAVCSSSTRLFCTGHDIFIQCQSVPNKSKLILFYNTAKYNHEHFHSVQADFKVFFDESHSKPTQRLCSFPLCNKLVTEKTNTLIGPENYSFPSLLHNPFEDSVVRFPHVIAVVDEDGQYTFSELDRRVNEIVCLIKTKSKISVKRVMIVLGRSFTSIATILAVLRLGATIVPIEKDWPALRIIHIVKDSNPDAVVVENIAFVSYLAKAWKSCFIPCIIFLDAHPTVANSVECFDKSVDLDIAFILYTSGTTGKPKGVLLHHKGLCNIIQYYMTTIGYAKKDEYNGHSTPYTFDSFFLEVFPALWTSSTLLILPSNPLEETRLFGFLRYVTFLHTQPVKLAFFDPSKFCSADKITFGGEAPTMELLDPWLTSENVPDRKLWNVYGPTEASIITTIARILDRVHLGSCTGNAQLKILNCNKQILPLGVPGELHIAGVGVAAGYTDQTLTDKFFWEDHGLRCYRTGDFVYLDYQEVLHFLGRIPKDRQIKVGGIRVELYEIEHALRTLQGVQFAHVTVRKGITNQLMAFVCPQSLEVDKIKSSLVSVLPAMLIPSIIVPISKNDITFNSSGKLVLKSYSHSEQESKLTESEVSKIELIFKKCLGSCVLDELLVSNKPLSACGIDSISVLVLISEINSVFKCSIRPSDILDKNISQLMAKFGHFEENDDEVSVQNCQNHTISTTAAFSALNQTIAGPAYNIPIVYHFVGIKNSLLLSSSVEIALVKIAEAYKRLNDQAITGSISTIVHVNLSELKNPYSVAIEESQQGALQIIDIKHARPYICKLFYLGGDEYILSLVIHHVAFDYGSLRLMEEVIEMAYTDDGFEIDKTVGSFDNYLTYLASQSLTRDDDLDYWSKHLINCKFFIDVPTSYSRSAMRPFIGQRLFSTIDKRDSEKILEICASMEVDPASFFLCLFNLIIYNLSYDTNFGIGVCISLRAERHLKNVIGYLANTIIFNFQPDLLKKPFSVFLQYLQSWTEKSVRHMTFPILKAAELAADINLQLHLQHYIPQYLYNFVSLERKELDLGSSLSVSRIDIETRTSKAELMLDVHFDGQVFEYSWEYCTSLYSFDSIQHVNNTFEAIMRHFLSNVNSFSYTWSIFTSAALSYQSNKSLGHKNVLSPVSNTHSLFLHKMMNMPINQQVQFQSTASAIISCAYSDQYIATIIESYIYSNELLCCHFVSSNKNWFLKSSCNDFRVNFETATSKQELATIKLRETMWPFDLLASPLFRITIIEHRYANSQNREVFIVAHQVLLSQVSLIRLTMHVASLLSNSLQGSYDSLCYRSISNESTPSSDLKSVQALSSQQRLPLVSTTSQGVISSSSTFSVKTLFEIYSMKSQALPMWCSFFSVIIYEITKAQNVQFALIASETSDDLTFLENIIPVYYTIDPKLSIEESCKQLSSLLLLNGTTIPYYWDIQEEVDPFLSLSHPYHEFLLHIIDESNCIGIKTTSSRSFNIVVTVNCFEKEVTLTTTLCPQQTRLIENIFSSVLSKFESSSPSRKLIEIEQTTTYNLSQFQGALKSATLTATELFMQVYESVPNRIAFCHISHEGDSYMTVREAFFMSSSIMHRITTLYNNEKNECIAILMTSGFELPLSVIAITMSRHSFLVLDPQDNVSVLIKKLKISNASCILYDYKSLDIVETISHSIPTINSMFIEVYYNQYMENTGAVNLSLSNLLEVAYIVFTSGTTGEPKPVSVYKDSLVNFLRWGVWNCLRQQHCIHISHTQFDVFIAEVLGQFVLESTMYLINHQLRLHSKYILKIIRRYYINNIFLTPTILSFFLGEEPFNFAQQWNTHTLPSLQHVLSAGEKLSSNLCAQFFQRFPPRTCGKVTLHNWGGPSECCIGYGHCIVNELKCTDFIPMGRPVPNSKIIIVNSGSHEILPAGIPGEIMVAGSCSQYQCSNHKGVVDIYGKTWFATGDIGFLDGQHCVVLLDRSDSQVKISGQRIELLGIYRLIIALQLPGILDVVVDVIGTQDLVCFIIVSDQSFKTRDYQRDLLMGLPKHHVPHVVSVLCRKDIPLLLSGKTDIKNLRKLASASSKSLVGSCSTSNISHKVISLLQKSINAIVPHVTSTSSWLHLKLDDLGISSLNKAQLHRMLNEEGFEVSMDCILMSHSISNLASRIENSCSVDFLAGLESIENTEKTEGEHLIGIIGMGVLLPGATTCDKFWDIIVQGKETISHNLPNIENLKSSDGEYIGSRGLVNNVYDFDYCLYGFSKEKADMMDPQQRLLLQSVYTTMEQIGIDSFSHAKVGCFAAIQFPEYLLDCILLDPNRRKELVWENLRDNTALVIGKYFDFQGPCVTLANNCSSVAVALHYARLSLLNNDCDIAVVVGANIYGKETGYITNCNDIYSRDGHCCPFSESASGTVMSDGVIVIILKRIDNDIEKENVFCSVKGTSLGSDGALSGCNQLIPSMQGQRENLNQVLLKSSVKSSSVELIEAHGSGTIVGDLIEVESLSAVFGNDGKEKVIGSVKGNIGHIGVAAAGPSIIKASMAIKQKVLPPSIHCASPIASIEKGNFKILNEPEEWVNSKGPRRALVHSVGALGTNVGIILEECNISSSTEEERKYVEDTKHLPCCISAQSSKSLKEYISVLFDFLSNNDIILLDALYSLSHCKRYGLIRISQTFASKKNLLSWLGGHDLIDATSATKDSKIIIAFSGQGEAFDLDQCIIYCNVLPCFQDLIQEYCKILEDAYSEHFPSSIYHILCGNNNSSEIQLNPPLHQVLTVIFHLALYHSLESIGLQVVGAFGHSLGEYSAACVSGIITTKEVLKIVFERALLIQSQVPAGKMLNTDLPLEELNCKYCLKASVQVACINSKNNYVLSGYSDDIKSLHDVLKKNNVRAKILDSMDHAYHHDCMLSIRGDFKRVLYSIKEGKSSTKKIFLSSLKDKCTVYPPNMQFDLSYFLDHLHTPVDYPETMNALVTYFGRKSCSIIEIGVKPILKVLSESHTFNSWIPVCLKFDDKTLLSSLCSIWENGIDLKMDKLLVYKKAHKVILPSYSFDTQYCKYLSNSNNQQDNNLYITSEIITYEEVFKCVSSFCLQSGSNFTLPVDSLELTSLRERVLIKFNVDIIEEIASADIQGLTNYIVQRVNVSKNTENPLLQVNPVQLLHCVDDSQKGLKFLFICHAVVTTKKFSFTPLVTILSSLYQVYGVYVPISILSNSKSSISEIAAYFVEKIQLVQSEGPYYIGGFSFGAWIAHSMADILHQRGEHVSRLILIDPINLRELSLEQVPAQVHCFLEFNEDMQLLSDHAFNDYYTQFQLQLKYLHSHKSLIKPVCCKVKILLAEDRVMKNKTNLLNKESWNFLCTNDSFIEILEVPGKHSTCLFPVNCIHIAKYFDLQNLELKNFELEITDSMHIIGEWILAEKLSSLKSRLTFNSNGKYTCMVPEIASMKSFVRQDELIVLNSTGNITIRRNKIAFEVELSSIDCEAKTDIELDCSIVISNRNTYLKLALQQIELLWNLVSGSM